MPETSRPSGHTDAPASAGSSTPQPTIIRVIRAPWVRLAVLALMVAAAVLAALNGGVSLAGIRSSIEGLGPAGPLAYVALYTVATVALLPGTPFTVAAGLLFGPLVGFLTALVGATLGATGSFVVGRAVGRRAVEQLAGPRVAAIDRFLGERGFVSILLVRLIPLFPFNVVNIVSGVTALRLREYVLATAIGIIPGTFLLAVLGGSIDDPTSPAFIGAAIGFVVLTVIVSLVARRSRQPSTHPGDEQ